MTREQRDRVLFDRIASAHARKDFIISLLLISKDQFFSAVKSVLDELPNPGIVVEIGCGFGASATYLAGHYERYIGIDQSEKMIKAAIIFNRDNPRAEFLAENIKSKKLPENIADVIISDGGLHHMTELELVMESLFRIAKPRAFLIVREPQNSNLLVQMIRRIRGIVDPSYSREQTFFSERYLRKLFAAHGIRDISVRFQGFLAPLFSQIVLSPQALVISVNRLAIAADHWFNDNLPAPLKRFGLDILVTGRFSKS